MREINKIIVHCSDTPSSMDIGAEEIHKWHTDKGWAMIGYHWVIRRDGMEEAGRPEWMVGAHCHGNNKDSLGICLVGRDEFTDDQQLWLFVTLDIKLQRHNLKRTDVYGHCEFDSGKTCPNEQVMGWLREWRGE